MADDDETTETDEETTEEESPNVRQMRKKLEAQERELKGLKRDAALLTAGVDLESPVGKLFAKAYDGDLTPDAIRAEAETVGALKTLATTTETITTEELPVDETETASTKERQTLATGATSDTGSTEDPRVAARRVADEARKGGAREEVVLGTHFHELVGAAMDGDRRVIIDPHLQQ